MVKNIIKDYMPNIYEILKNNKIKIRNKYYNSLSKKEMEVILSKMYKENMNRELDWNNLNTYTEKMQWAKLYDNNPIKTKLSDKYEVREWVRNKIGEKYLIPLLGSWENPDEIDFQELPEEFVLKTNHASGTILVVKSKKKLDIKETKKTMKKWLKKEQTYSYGFQLQYKNIKPLIIAEKYIEDKNKLLNDYKFLCFNGMVYYCWVDFDRNNDHRRNVYNLKWELQPWNQHHYKNTTEKIPKPKKFDKMIEIASILCQGFSHVRVDLYNVDGEIFFGEMTFTNGSGFEGIYPLKYDYILGELWKLPIDN